MSESINHPSHYGGDSTYECINVLRNWLTKEEYIGFLRGNVLKYICRCERKDDMVEDLQKAEWYLHMLISLLKE